MTYNDGTYLADNHGVVWVVVRDGGMVTRADYTGAHSAGIAWLEKERGPLRELRVFCHVNDMAGWLECEECSRRTAWMPEGDAA